MSTHCRTPGKMKIRSKKHAIDAARRARARTGGELITHYRCDACRAWHIGHSIPEVRRAYRGSSA